MEKWELSLTILQAGVAIMEFAVEKLYLKS